MGGVLENSSSNAKFAGKWVALTLENKIVDSADTYEELLSKIAKKDQSKYIYTRITGSNTVCVI